PGLGSSADFWFAMSASLPPTEPSSISPASGLHSAGVYETRSKNLIEKADLRYTRHLKMLNLADQNLNRVKGDKR
ncbi:MAG: hypothetical protein ACLQM6_09135, partial [Acidobacteriaceae bacterium]